MKLSEKTLKILAFISVLIGAILDFNEHQNEENPNNELPSNKGEL